MRAQLAPGKRALSLEGDSSSQPTRPAEEKEEEEEEDEYYLPPPPGLSLPLPRSDSLGGSRGGVHHGLAMPHVRRASSLTQLGTSNVSGTRLDGQV